MLLFKKRFLEAIRRGEKTQTVRLWKHRRMKSGQRSYIPGAGPIWIELVEPIDLADLSDEDARRDGFATVRELRAALKAIYDPSEANQFTAYRVIFSLLAPDQQSDDGA